MMEHYERLIALILIAVGLLLMFMPHLDAFVLLVLISIAAIVSGISVAVHGFLRRNWIEILLGIAGALLGAFIWTVRKHALSIFAGALAVYFFLLAAIFSVSLIIAFRDQIKHKILLALRVLFCLSLGILFWNLKSDDGQTAFFLTGLYLALLGLEQLFEMYLFKHKKGGTQNWNLRFWIALPAAIVSILPSIILRVMLKEQAKHVSIPTSVETEEEKPDLKVWIHTGLGGEHAFGHMTFSLDGIMYSYGNYDTKEEILFRSLGPGILFTVPEQIYVNNSCVYEKSTIFEFGLKLEPEKLEKLKKEIQKQFNESYPWECELQTPIPSHEKFAELEKEYSDRLYWRTGAKFRKFRKGPWKTYWLMGDNCSSFASYMLQIADPDVHKAWGISTPGEYFEYFITALQDPHSSVMYCSYHTPDDPKTLFPALA
jgi:uncharacterized membrane protein HdeD (DUF308 family)